MNGLFENNLNYFVWFSIGFFGGYWIGRFWNRSNEMEEMKNE